MYALVLKKKKTGTAIYYSIMQTPTIITPIKTKPCNINKDWAS